MIQNIKRYFAIRSYVYGLGGELARRFGARPFYPVDLVTQAAKRGGFSIAFIPYAHAIFCNQDDFDSRYSPALKSNYFERRRQIAVRYFSGQIDFDARTIVAGYRPPEYVSGGYYESGIGITGTEHN